NLRHVGRRYRGDAGAVRTERRIEDYKDRRPRPGDHLAGGRIPQRRGFGPAGGEDAPAVGTEGGPLDLVPMPKERAEGTTGRRVPNPRLTRACEFAAPGEDAPAVGAEGGIVHLSAVLERRRHRSTSGRV